MDNGFVLSNSRDCALFVQDQVQIGYAMCSLETSSIAELKILEDLAELSSTWKVSFVRAEVELKKNQSYAVKLNFLSWKSNAIRTSFYAELEHKTRQIKHLNPRLWLLSFYRDDRCECRSYDNTCKQIGLIQRIVVEYKKKSGECFEKIESSIFDYSVVVCKKMKPESRTMPFYSTFEKHILSVDSAFFDKANCCDWVQISYFTGDEKVSNKLKIPRKCTMVFLLSMKRWNAKLSHKFPPFLKIKILLLSHFVLLKPGWKSLL